MKGEVQLSKKKRQKKSGGKTAFTMLPMRYMMLRYRIVLYFPHKLSAIMPPSRGKK